MLILPYVLKSRYLFVKRASAKNNAKNVCKRNCLILSLMRWYTVKCAFNGSLM